MNFESSNSNIAKFYEFLKAEMKFVADGSRFDLVLQPAQHSNQFLQNKLTDWLENYLVSDSSLTPFHHYLKYLLIFLLIFSVFFSTDKGKYPAKPDPGTLSWCESGNGFTNTKA